MNKCIKYTCTVDEVAYAVACQFLGINRGWNENSHFNRAKDERKGKRNERYCFDNDDSGGNGSIMDNNNNTGHDLRTPKNIQMRTRQA